MSDLPSPPQPPPNSGYGPPAAYAQPPYYAPAQAGNGIAIAGGVCGIIAVVFCWIPFVDFFSLILGALAVIFGGLGLRHANTHGGTSKGMAITGVITGIVALVIALIVLIAFYSSASVITYG